MANNTNVNRRNTDLTTPAVGPVAINEKKVVANNGPMDVNATSPVTRKTAGNAVGTGPDVGALVTNRKGVGNNANGTSMMPVAGIVGGKVGGKGPVTNSVVNPVEVSKVHVDPPPAVTKQVASQASAARVLSEPNANDFITEDAKKNHIAGLIRVKIHVLASGVGQVMGLSGPGLGHGLDEASLNVARQIRWRPATDATGKPIDSDITIGIRFQSAGVE